MTAKEYLGQVYRIDRQIENKLSQVESLRSLATKVTSAFSNMPHSSTPDNHKFEKTIDKIIDLEKDINTDIDKLVYLKRDINQIIKQVENPKHKMLLEMRYLNFQTWEQIAVALNCDVRHIYRLHGESLKKIKISGKCH